MENDDYKWLLFTPETSDGDERCNNVDSRNDDEYCDVDNEAAIYFYLIPDLFESMHCYFLHQYDIGYRLRVNDEEIAGIKESEDVDDLLLKVIRSKMKHLKLISRLMKEKKYRIELHAMNFFKNEEYDSDSIKDDLCNEDQSNLKANLIEQPYKIVKSCVSSAKCMCHMSYTHQSLVYILFYH